MARYIDADALAKWLDKEHYVDRPSGKCDERQNRMLGIVISALKNPQIAPTIDAEPVRHGRWELYEDWGSGMSRVDPPEPFDAGWKCSCCGIDLLQYLKSHFPDIPSYAECASEETPTLERCPCCGAKMDAKEEAE